MNRDFCVNFQSQHGPCPTAKSCKAPVDLVPYPTNFLNPNPLASSPNPRAQFGGAIHGRAELDAEGVVEFLHIHMRPDGAELAGGMGIGGDEPAGLLLMHVHAHVSDPSFNHPANWANLLTFTNPSEHGEFTVMNALPLRFYGLVNLEETGML